MKYSTDRRAVVCFVRSLLIIIILSFSPACMMMGLHKSAKSSVAETAKADQPNELMLIDHLISKAINDLSTTPDLSIESLAVWSIETRSGSIDAENIRQKIITSLVNNTSYKVISREHLDKLLVEQSLSLSGTIDSSKAINIGKLIGVQGFVSGYISKQNDHIELNLNLIQTSSGEVIWATVQKR